jgi:hypothetical protein
MNRFREALPRGLESLAPLLLALALVAAGAAAARYARDSGARAETLLLAAWSAAVLLPLGWAGSVGAVRGRGARRAAAGAALAAAMVVALLPRSGATRPAAVATILVIALLTVAAALLRAPRRAASGVPGLAALGALALATALLAYGPRLWAAPLAAASWLLALALPALAAGVARFFARRGEPREGALAGGLVLLVPLIASERWWVISALGTLYLVARSATLLARAASGALAVTAALALLAGSFPWLRPEPVSTILSGLFAPPVESVDLGRRAAVLSAAAPGREVAAAGAPLSALAVDSYLTHSTGLACGAKLAEVELVGSSGSFRGDLVVGRDSAEWAAERGDVAGALACDPPPPFARFIPSTGRFFGRTTRARLELPRPFAAERIRVVRDAALPADLSLAIFHLAAER